MNRRQWYALALAACVALVVLAASPVREEDRRTDLVRYLEQRQYQEHGGRRPGPAPDRRANDMLLVLVVVVGGVTIWGLRDRA